MRQALLMIMIVVGLLYADQVPPEVQKIFNEVYSSWDSTFFNAKKGEWGFDGSTKLSEIKAGEPFRIYAIDLRTTQYSDSNTPISILAKPGDDWAIPLLVNDVCKCFITVSSKQGWHVGNMWENMREWQKVREAWPSAKGYHPILIVAGFRNYVYVPEINEHNLTPLHRNSHDSVSMLVDTTFKNLMSSSTVIEFIKNHDKARPNEVGATYCRSN